MIVICLIFVSGCVKINVTQKIRSDGYSFVEIEYDMSGMEGMLSINESAKEEFIQNMSNTCSEFKNKGEFLNPGCEFSEDDFILKLTGELDLRNDPALKIDGNVYEYDAFKIIDLLSTTPGANPQNTEGEEMTEEQKEQTKTMMKTVGMEFLITIEMPGEITEADYGEIDENTVVINMVDLMDENHIYIKSEVQGFQLDENTIMMIVMAVIVIIIAALSLQIMRMKKASQMGNA